MADKLDKDEAIAKLCEQMGIDLSPGPHWLDELSDVLLTISCSLVYAYIFVCIMEILVPGWMEHISRFLLNLLQPSNPSAFG